MCDRMYKFNFYFILLIAALASVATAQQIPEVKAIQYFNSGDYSESEKLFLLLLEGKPTDPMYNYYYGASRTENGHYSDQELECLTIAEKHFTPERLYYYLGIQHHARQNWSQALKYYNQFKLSVPETEQNHLDLNNKIQLCFNRENPFLIPPVAKADETREDKDLQDSPSFVTINIDESLTASTDPALSANDEFNETEEDLYLPRNVLPNLPGVKAALPAGEQIEFPIDNFITYYFTSQFQTSDGSKLFQEAIALQEQQDNLITKADRLREEYKETTDHDTRSAIASEIMQLERKAFELEEKILHTFNHSRENEKAFWNNADPASKNNFLIEQENILTQLTGNNYAQRQEQEAGENEILLLDIDSPEITAPKQNSSSKLIYKIQIGAYSKCVPAYKQRLFNKLSIIRTIENYTDEKGIKVYTTGNLTRLEDAIIMQNQVRQEGIQDAKVVPYIDGKRITLDQAKQLEAKNDI